jgi:hypothetical protein
MNRRVIALVLLLGAACGGAFARQAAPRQLTKAVEEPKKQ